MPHIIVKLWPGRSDKIKSDLAKQIALDVARGLDVEIGDVSVAFEEVDRKDWGDQVYKKEIKITAIFILNQSMSINSYFL